MEKKQNRLRPKGDVNVESVSEDSQKASSYNSGSVITKDSKVTTNISEIFLLNSNSKEKHLKIILVEGSPGIGKTIQFEEIAFQWASKKYYTSCC